MKKIALIVIALILSAGAIAFNYDYESISPPLLSVLVSITRNGQPVPPGQIRSVRYLISQESPQALANIRDKTLRDANIWPSEATAKDETFYLLNASFDIIHRGYIFQTTTVTPEFHSVFLRITFMDGKTVSLTSEMTNETRPPPVIHVDLGESQVSP